MNSPESIVVSLEWAKKLKKAGWPQDDGCFWYREIMHTGAKRMHRTLIDREAREHCQTNPLPNPTAIKSEEWFDATTAEEILWRLPEYLNQRDIKGELHFYKWPDGFSCGYSRWDSLPNGYAWAHMMKADTLANAAAAMWCHLKENNLLPES